MSFDPAMITKGRKVPYSGLVDQAGYHLKLINQYLAELKANGWTDADNTELSSVVTDLLSDRSFQTAVAEHAKDTTRLEVAGRGVGKGFTRKLRNIVRFAVAAANKAGVTGVTVESFNAGAPLANKSSAIRDYLTKIKPSVELLDPYLLRFFDQKKASLLLEAARDGLQDADSDQEVAHVNKPEATKHLYETMGKTMALIEMANAIAKNAFAGQAEVIGKFNKDLILRARTERKAPQTPVVVGETVKVEEGKAEEAKVKEAKGGE